MDLASDDDDDAEAALEVEDAPMLAEDPAAAAVAIITSVDDLLRAVAMEGRVAAFDEAGLDDLEHLRLEAANGQLGVLFETCGIDVSAQQLVLVLTLLTTPASAPATASAATEAVAADAGVKMEMDSAVAQQRPAKRQRSTERAPTRATTAASAAGETLGPVAPAALDAAASEGLTLVPAASTQTGYKGVHPQSDSAPGFDARMPFVATLFCPGGPSIVASRTDVGTFSTPEEAALALARKVAEPRGGGDGARGREHVVPAAGGGVAVGPRASRGEPARPGRLGGGEARGAAVGDGAAADGEIGRAHV